MVRLGLRWCLQQRGWVCDGEARFVTVRLGLASVRVRICNGERVNQRRSESELTTVRSGFSLFAIWKYREQCFL